MLDLGCFMAELVDQCHLIVNHSKVTKLSSNDNNDSMSGSLMTASVKTMGLEWFTAQ